jgi:hypothetical protein
MYVAACPAFTVSVDGEAGATEKSSPVPESDTVCGLFPAPSVMVSVPVLEPLAVGSKNTPTEQLAPTVKVVPQVFNWPKSAGLATMLAILIATLPVLVSVTF